MIKIMSENDLNINITNNIMNELNINKENFKLNQTTNIIDSENYYTEKYVTTGIINPRNVILKFINSNEPT